MGKIRKSSFEAVKVSLSCLIRVFIQPQTNIICTENLGYIHLYFTRNWDLRDKMPYMSIVIDHLPS